MKNLRMKKKLSISQTADMVGVSPSTYRDWEYGREIRGEPYAKISEVLGVSLNYLITGKESLLEERLRQLEGQIQEIRTYL